MSVRLRAATLTDVPYLVALASDPTVEPFLAAARAKDEDAVRAEVARAEAEPDAFGVLVIELDRDGEWSAVGAVQWQLVNRRSRIAELSGLALEPGARGAGVAADATRQLQRLLLLGRGLHRLQLEVYAFNEPALRHAERVGFVREGVRRRAYWRHGTWVDGVLFGLLREDLDAAT